MRSPYPDKVLPAKTLLLLCMGREYCTILPPVSCTLVRKYGSVHCTYYKGTINLLKQSLGVVSLYRFVQSDCGCCLPPSLVLFAALPEQLCPHVRL